MTDKVEFDQAQYLDVLQFLSKGVPAYVMRVDGEPVACGGVYHLNGEWWGYLEVRGRPKPQAAMKMVRMMRRFIRSHGQTLNVACDVRLKQAPRLLATLGFFKTDRLYNGMEVYQWPKSH